ncbi:uncharacterized protein LOC132751184, partial [Ruditapes philippinarum]|uniref:uncharacterized protein LOC132751184 n=1 Tax=Ruditapes philippinarum TaxID=129788 RepID=UPI00295AECAC
MSCRQVFKNYQIFVYIFVKEGTAADAVDMVGLFKLFRFSQLEVGKFLEICYIQLKDHPVEAGKVRGTANEARTQHGMCSGLMKQFMTTSEFVTSDMMPMLKTVIKERKSKIIKDMLERILQMADDMKKEAENVRDRYLALRTQLQQNIVDVNIRNKEVMDQTKYLTIEKNEAESMEQQSEKEITEMEKERQETLTELQNMKQKRDEFLANALPTKTDDETWKDIMNMAVPNVQQQLRAIQAAKMPLHLFRQGMRAYTAFKGQEKTQRAIEKEDDKQSKLNEQIRERQETSLKRLAQIKRTDLKIATMGDVKGLLEALKLLSQVDKMFNEIILFWDNMSVFLKRLYYKTGAGKSFLNALKTKQYARMFEDTISKAEA